MNPTRTVQRAKAEIKSVLRRYGLRWDEAAPDRDDEIWRAVRPTAKKIRKQLLRKTYPSLST